MAWTAPMTAVANEAFTAAQFNTNIRDNLLETVPALATAAGQMPVADGTNSLEMRSIGYEFVAAEVSTTSTSYTILTGGPDVTLTTGSTVLLFMQAEMANTVSASAHLRMSVAVSGDTTIPANDQWAYVKRADSTSSLAIQSASCAVITGLNPGINTFTVRYSTSTGTGEWANRLLVVLPFF